MLPKVSDQQEQSLTREVNLNCLNLFIRTKSHDNISSYHGSWMEHICLISEFVIRRVEFDDHVRHGGKIRSGSAYRRSCERQQGKFKVIDIGRFQD